MNIIKNWAKSGPSSIVRVSVSENGELFVQRILPIGILAVAMICVPVQILRPEGLPRMRGLESELHGVQDENAELTRDITRLRREVHELKDDPGSVEKIARDRLGLVRKSEIVFQIGNGRPAAISRRSDTLPPQ
jgi:cell division protein FtsB